LNTYEGTGKKNGFFNLSGVKSNQIISEGDIMSAQHFGPLLFVTWGIPLCGLYRYVQPQRVWFWSCFGLKKVIDFNRGNIALKGYMLLILTIWSDIFHSDLIYGKFITLLKCLCEWKVTCGH